MQFATREADWNDPSDALGLFGGEEFRELSVLDERSSCSPATTPRTFFQQWWVTAIGVRATDSRRSSGRGSGGAGRRRAPMTAGARTIERVAHRGCIASRASAASA
jgi:hypothetical protein